MTSMSPSSCTETDVQSLGYGTAQQPNTRWIRTWEVAGTAHSDAYELGPFAKLLGCTTPINSGPQHPVVEAALSALTGWMTTGAAPPVASELQLASSNPIVIARDRFGNAIGGVRTPSVDVPVATVSGIAPRGANALCSLLGSTTPFAPDELQQLYHTKAEYLADYQQSLSKTIAGGYVRASDRVSLLAQAQNVQFPR
jgi:Alpha/beta hydrolase domain